MYGPVGNALRNGILSPLNLFFDGPHPWHLQGFFRWWTLPPTIPIMPSCIYRNSSDQPILKTLYNHQHLSCHYPYFTSIQQQHMNHCLVYHLPCPYHRSCLFQLLFHHYPPPYGLLTILVQGCPVTIIVFNSVAQLQEGRCGIHRLRVHTDDQHTVFKTVLEGLPLPPPLLLDLAPIQVIVVVI